MMAFINCVIACMTAFIKGLGPLAIGAVVACILGLWWAGVLGLLAAIACIAAILGAAVLIGLIACIACC